MRFCLIGVAVFVLSVASNEVPDEKAYLRPALQPGDASVYRLSVEALERMLAAERDVLSLVERDFRERKVPLDLTNPIGIDAAVELLNRNAEIRASLAAHGTTADELLRTIGASLSAILLIELIDQGHAEEPRSEVSQNNVRMWRSPPPHLVAAMEEWKQEHIGTALEELRR